MPELHHHRHVHHHHHYREPRPILLPALWVGTVLGVLATLILYLDTW